MLETVSLSRSHTTSRREQEEKQRKQLAISTLFGTGSPHNSNHYNHLHQDKQTQQEFDQDLHQADRVEIAPNSPYSDNKYPTRLGQLLDTTDSSQFVMTRSSKLISSNRTPPMPQHENQRAFIDGYNSSPSNSSSSTTPDASLNEIHQPPSNFSSAQLGNNNTTAASTKTNNNYHHYAPLQTHDMSSYNTNRTSRILSSGDVPIPYNPSNSSRQSSRSTLANTPQIPPSPRESLLGVSPTVQPYIHHHPAGHSLNKRASLQRKKSLDPSYNKHTSLSAAAGTAGPTSGAITPREQKRQSRFGWFSSSRNSSVGNGNLPNISEPVLEYSTSELVLDGRRSMAIGPRQSSLMNMGDNNFLNNGGISMTTTATISRSSTNVSGRVSIESMSRRPPRPDTPNHAEAPPSTDQDKRDNISINQGRTSSEEGQVERFEREIIDRNSRIFSSGSVSGSSIASDRQMSFADRLDKEIHDNASKSPVTNKRNSNVVISASPSLSQNSISMEEVAELKRKLKESDDKRRLMIIEYQQKIDSEKKRATDLQKKLDSLNKYVNEKKIQSDNNSAKIKSLESQRDVLRQALVTLKEAKDMKINEYKNQLEKSRVTRFSMLPSLASMSSISQSTTSSPATAAFTATETAQSSSSVSNSSHQTPNSSQPPTENPSPTLKPQSTFESNLRIGLGPLLPINTAVSLNKVRSMEPVESMKS